MQKNGHNPQTMPQKTLDVHGLARYLGIGINGAYALARRPDFPAIRISERRIIIPVDVLDRWLEEQAGV